MLHLTCQSSSSLPVITRHSRGRAAYPHNIMHDGCNIFGMHGTTRGRAMDSPRTPVPPAPRVSIHSGPPCPRRLPPRCGRTRYAASGFVTRDYASEASGMEGGTGRAPGPPVRSVHPRGHPARLPRGVREAPTVTRCSEQLPIGKGTPRGRGKLRRQGSRPRSLPRPVHQRNAPTRACEQVWCHSQRPHPGKMAAHN